MDLGRLSGTGQLCVALRAPQVLELVLTELGEGEMGRGCERALLNIDEKRVAGRILEEIQYLELTTQETFEHAYAMAMYFPHYDIDAFPSLKDAYKDIPVR